MPRRHRSGCQCRVWTNPADGPEQEAAEPYARTPGRPRRIVYDTLCGAQLWQRLLRLARGVRDKMPVPYAASCGGSMWNAASSDGYSSSVERNTIYQTPVTGNNSSVHGAKSTKMAQ